MRKIFKKLPMFLLAMLILMCTANADTMNVPDTGTGIAPQYVVITSFKAKLDIGNSGKAACSAKVSVSSANYSVTLDCSLCESDGSVVKSWSTTGKGTVSLDKSWYVTSGSRYQVVASATVYDANGNYVDSGTAYSSVVSY